MNISEQLIVIAGGSGLIGQQLQQLLEQKGAKVRILTRKPTKKNHFYWDPLKKGIDQTALTKCTILINLSGENIADGRWTKKRKLRLKESRVNSNLYLSELANQLPDLKLFISASGINAYEPNQEVISDETEPFGQPYLCQLTREWEESALQFNARIPVAIIRTAVVISDRGGAYTKLAQLTKYWLGSGLGSGKQAMPWIHITDLTAIYLHVIEKELHGIYNAVAGCDTNNEFMRKLALSLNKPFFLPNVPGWLLKLLLGEMSTMLLDGVRASHAKLTHSGYTFIYPELQQAFNSFTKD